MDNKLPRLFTPNMRLYFVFLIIFAVFTFFFGEHSHILAAAELVVIVFLSIYTRYASKKRTEKLLGYIESMTDGMESATRDMPLPVVMVSCDTNAILWSNDRFASITGAKESFFETSITDFVPGFTATWLLDGKSEAPDPLEVRGRRYRVYGSLVRSERRLGKQEYVAATYWVDITDYLQIYEEYLNTRPVHAIMALDNYDEFLKGLGEKDKSIRLSEIDEKINEWAAGTDGYLCKYDRDRYLFLFEERYMPRFTEDKFSILESVRTVSGASGVFATLSVGVGKDGNTPEERFHFASLALEMALSRGGDQAVIKNRFGFEFFGGHSAEVEKRTKVRSRVMASAFGELIGDASTVFVMGHRGADLDCVGAAVGVCCIARSRGRPVKIVIDLENNYSQQLIERVLQSPDYKNTFITAQDAILEADSKSLLVVVDTSRPEMVESEALLMSLTRIAVIDHHRRAATYIENAVLNFHEPYASSSCELITELIQYLLEPGDIQRLEAEALLSGIVLDTKGFAIHTGSRTFEAAAFLRRAGADTIDVKRLMQSDFETARHRYEIISGAEMYAGGIAIAASNEPRSKVSVAQAADELLNIAGVRSSFVLSRDGWDVFVSGRSIGTLNVQMILERLGGGGNQSTAGLHLKGVDIDTALSLLKESIDKYLADTRE